MAAYTSVHTYLNTLKLIAHKTSFSNISCDRRRAFLHNDEVKAEVTSPDHITTHIHGEGIPPCLSISSLLPLIMTLLYFIYTALQG